MREHKHTPEELEDEDYLNNHKYPIVCFSPRESGAVDGLDKALQFHGLELVLQTPGCSDAWYTIEPII